MGFFRMINGYYKYVFVILICWMLNNFVSLKFFVRLCDIVINIENLLDINMRDVE